MTQKTLSDIGYEIIHDDGRIQQIRKTGTADTPEISSYQIRQTPRPGDCEISLGYLRTPCSREDRDCDECHRIADERSARISADHREAVRKQKERLESLPALPENQVYVWYDLSRLCGCSDLTTGMIRGKSIYVTISETQYRISKEKFDAGERQFRGSWCIEKLDPARHAPEAVRDANWMD